jgi:hypothetical protein
MVLERWRARRQAKAKAKADASQQHRLRVIADVKDAVVAADPARVGPAAARLLAGAIASSPGSALARSLHGTAPSALAEFRAGLDEATPMGADTAEQLYIAVDGGWDQNAEASHLLEAIENWVEYLKDPTASAAESVLWLTVLAHDDEPAALQRVRLLLASG